MTTDTKHIETLREELTRASVQLRNEVMLSQEPILRRRVDALQAAIAALEGQAGECEACGGEGEIPEGFPSSFGDPAMKSCPDCTPARAEAQQAEGREAGGATHGLYEIPAWESHVQAKVGVERFRDQVIVAHCTSRDEAEKVAAALNGQPHMLMPMDEAIRVGNQLLADARHPQTPTASSEAGWQPGWVFFHTDDFSGGPFASICRSGAKVRDAVIDWLGGEEACKADDGSDMSEGIAAELIRCGKWQPEGDPPCYLAAITAPALEGQAGGNVVPGVMRCAKCDFRVQRMTLYTKSGTVGAGDNKTEPCPNGCGPLWPVTWEQEARECYKRMEEMFDQQQATPAPEGQARGETQWPTLKAMATNYKDGHRWDHLDGEACMKAADEIKALRAEIAQMRGKCWQHRPNAPCPNPESCRENGCSAVGRVASAIAKVIGHGMGEKCEPHALAAIDAMKGEG